MLIRVQHITIFRIKYSDIIYHDVHTQKAEKMSGNRLRIAIIGSGNIGTDLLIKVRRSGILKCSLFVGRRLDSPGLERARKLGIQVTDGGVEALLEKSSSLDLIFDATSAEQHNSNFEQYMKLGLSIINLTPAPVGQFYVPLVTDDLTLMNLMDKHLNMVTCGGQTVIPILHSITNGGDTVLEAEIVSTISSNSAGIATRQNLDEYIANTESAIKKLTLIEKSKVMLILNPAVPEIIMHTSCYLTIDNPDLERIKFNLKSMLNEMQIKNPGLKLINEPVILKNSVVHFAIVVEGHGDYFPKYAGNLDIINVAAVSAAESLAMLVEK
jgi:acetaldehyde dehydrogenase (acetylating)